MTGNDHRHAPNPKNHLPGNLKIEKRERNDNRVIHRHRKKDDARVHHPKTDVKKDLITIKRRNPKKSPDCATIESDLEEASRPTTEGKKIFEGTTTIKDAKLTVRDITETLWMK